MSSQRQLRSPVGENPLNHPLQPKFKQQAVMKCYHFYYKVCKKYAVNKMTFKHTGPDISTLDKNARAYPSL